MNDKGTEEDYPAGLEKRSSGAYDSTGPEMRSIMADDPTVDEP